MKLIINADDFGLTNGVCDAIINLLEKRAISNTTVMICSDGAFEQCKKLRDKGLSKYIGVHLQTTPGKRDEKPLSPIDEIPTLVNKKGLFKDKNHTDWINPIEIEVEWERQIIKTMDALGHKPSHLDSHHGIHTIPELQSTYLNLANKYNIPVRGGNEINQIDGSKLGVKSSSIIDIDWTGQDKDLDFLKKVIQTKIFSIHQ